MIFGTWLTARAEAPATRPATDAADALRQAAAAGLLRPVLPADVGDDDSPNPAQLPARGGRGGDRAAAAPSRAELSREIAALGDEDPAAREAARTRLMALYPGDLPALRDAAAAVPLCPAQAAALRDVVGQVFLSGQPYPAVARQGMLGLHWDGDDLGGEANAEPGVVVGNRIPGFDAYRSLRAGDVLLRIADEADGELHAHAQVSAAVQGLPPGAVVTLEVLRRGQVVRVDVTLAPWRQLRGDGELTAWMNQRAQSADDYFRREFEPVTGEALADGG